MTQKPPRRKIALFNTSFLPYSQTFIYDEIRTHSDNYSVTVFCKERLNEELFPYPHVHKPGGAFSKFLYENIGYWPAFNRIIKTENFDLVHAHFGTGAVYALPYIKKHNLPFVVTFHGNDVAALMGTQKYHYSRWRYVIKSSQIFEHSSLVLAASNELAEILVELGADENKVKVHRLGIDLDRFSYSDPVENKPVTTFVMVGRFTPKKGHLYALKALKTVIKKGYQAELSFIGSGELKNDLTKFIQEQDLSNFVHFKGVMSPGEVSRQLTESDVLLAPSVVGFDHDRESGLIVVKEASASGRPAIGTWHGGIPEIIDHETTGFLVPERNSDLLANRMIEFIEQPELKRKFGKAARDKMEREYDLHKQTKKLETHYESILRN